MFRLGLFVDGLYGLGLYFRAFVLAGAPRVSDRSRPYYRVTDLSRSRYRVRDCSRPRYRVTVL